MSTTVGVIGLRPCITEAHGRTTPTAPQVWSQRFSLLHAVIASGLLVGLSACWTAFGSQSAAGIGGEVLLVGGALIGVPHGASDFLTAHRVFGRVLGRLWLPVFVLTYLILVLAVLAAWRVSPVVTLPSFVLISSLHFAGEDIEAYGLPPSWFRWLARASTPLLPIVMLHLPEVSPFFATMSGQDVDAVIAALQPFRAPLLGAWLVVLATTLLSSLTYSDRHTERGVETFELIALSVAAAVLPPLLTFAVYFCIIHAVRHMTGLAAELHPCDGRRAWRVSTLIVVPSAMVCVVILAGCWSAIFGVMTTDRLLCRGLQLLAALTVPHMILKAIGKNVDGRPARPVIVLH